MPGSHLATFLHSYRLNIQNPLGWVGGCTKISSGLPKDCLLGFRPTSFPFRNPFRFFIFFQATPFCALVIILLEKCGSKSENLSTLTKVFAQDCYILFYMHLSLYYEKYSCSNIRTQNNVSTWFLL